MCWNYLNFVMVKMGFSEKWRLWMSECWSSASVSVLLNGSPTEEFCMGKGLRQGDPLSPFLFLIAAEGLSVMFSKAVELGLFKGYSVETRVGGYALTICI